MSPGFAVSYPTLDAVAAIASLEYSLLSVLLPAIPSTGVNLFWIWKARTASAVVWPYLPSIDPS